jgi:hypothetical protein
MDTEALINQLAANLTPAPPLARPWARTAVWLLFALLCVAAMVAVLAPIEDVRARMASPLFVVEQAAALATGVLAAFAAFSATVPGSDRRILMLPFVGAAAWMATLGVECLQDWRTLGAAALVVRSDWPCVEGIILGGLAPAVCILLMLRRGAPLTPRLTAAFAIVAAAGSGNLGMCLAESHPVGMVVLVWHGGALLMLAATAAWAGPHVFHWRRAGA